MVQIRPFRGSKFRHLRRSIAVIGLFIAPLYSVEVFAQTTVAESSEVARAREYFRAGAQAYSIGEYSTAVQAFEQAYFLAPRPAVLFSIAQAEKRQYVATHKREHLEKAVRTYRKYIEEETQPGRKTDAVSALAELEPLLNPPEVSKQRFDPSGTSSTPDPVAPTRLMLTSPAEGAILALDGEKAQFSPLIREVTPGDHVVVVSAPGYVSDERRIVAVEGALVTFDIALTERPAKLHVVGPDGAELRIDGRLQGTCPFPRPLEVAAGDHLVTFTDSGYVTWSSDVRAERGKTTTVVARMPRTIQRTSALILFGAAASAVTASGFLAYFTLKQENSAEMFLDERKKSELSSLNLGEYNSVRIDRDRLRIATLTTAGIGVGLAALGAFLFNYDSERAPKAQLNSAKRFPIGSPNSDEKHSFSNVTPDVLLSPGFTGLSLQGSF
jgi:PEGA domain